jgi:hypothetical protein
MPPGLSLPSILLVFVFLFVPGFGITFALQPPATASLPVRIALAFAFGYAVSGIVSFALAMVNHLTQPLFLTGVTIATIVAWVLAARRRRDHLRAIKEDVLSQWKRYVTFAVIFLGVLVVRSSYAPTVNFVPTTLRYWADAVEIADAHRIPSYVLQWDQLLKPTTSKVVLNTFNAGMRFSLGRGPLSPTGSLLLVGSIALVFGAYALAEELGLWMVAPLLPVLLFVNGLVGNTELTSDLRQNQAENWGRIAMIAVLILAVRALKPLRAAPDGQAEPKRRVPLALRDSLAAGVMLAVAAGTHLIPTAIGIAFAASYAIMRMVLDRDALRVLKLSGAALLVAAVLGGIVLILPKGDLGFQGAGGDKGYDTIRADLGLPATFDPTLFLVNGNVEKSSVTFPYSPVKVVSDFAYQVVARNARSESSQSIGWVEAVLPSLFALIGVVVLLIWGNRDLKAIAGTALLFMFVVLGVAMAFAARYDLYALETFGNRRLFNYIPIPFALVALGLLELLVAWIGRRFGSSEKRAWVLPVTAGVLCVAIAAAVMPSAWVPAQRLDSGQADLALIYWLGAHDPCQGRILADRRTLATFEAFDGRPGVLEGMGPHVRPDVLQIALSELFRATYFFQDPSSSISADYLKEKGVAYVVETKHILGGWSRVWHPNLPGLDASPYLKQVFANDAGTVYQVVGWTPNPALPNPAGQPGYCKP